MIQRQTSSSRITTSWFLLIIQIKLSARSVPSWRCVLFQEWLYSTIPLSALECLPTISSKYFWKDRLLVAPVITSTASSFTFHVHCSSVNESLHLIIFSALLVGTSLSNSMHISVNQKTFTFSVWKYDIRDNFTVTLSVNLNGSEITKANASECLCWVYNF